MGLFKAIATVLMAIPEMPKSTGHGTREIALMSSEYLALANGKNVVTLALSRDGKTTIEEFSTPPHAGRRIHVTVPREELPKMLNDLARGDQRLTPTMEPLPPVTALMNLAPIGSPRLMDLWDAAETISGQAPALRIAVVADYNAHNFPNGVGPSIEDTDSPVPARQDQIPDEFLAPLKDHDVIISVASRPTSARSREADSPSRHLVERIATQLVDGNVSRRLATSAGVSFPLDDDGPDTHDSVVAEANRVARVDVVAKALRRRVLDANTPNTGLALEAWTNTPPYAQLTRGLANERRVQAIEAERLLSDPAPIGPKNAPRSFDPAATGKAQNGGSNFGSQPSDKALNEGPLNDSSRNSHEDLTSIGHALNAASGHFSFDREVVLAEPSRDLGGPSLASPFESALPGDYSSVPTTSSSDLTIA